MSQWCHVVIRSAITLIVGMIVGFAHSRIERKRIRKQEEETEWKES